MQRMTFRYEDRVFFDDVRYSKNDALRRLAEYEETGLSPDEVLQLIDEVEKLRKTVDSSRRSETKKGWFR